MERDEQAHLNAKAALDEHVEQLLEARYRPSPPAAAELAQRAIAEITSNSNDQS